MIRSDLMREGCKGLILKEKRYQHLARKAAEPNSNSYQGAEEVLASKEMNLKRDRGLATPPATVQPAYHIQRS